MYQFETEFPFMFISRKCEVEHQCLARICNSEFEKKSAFEVADATSSIEAAIAKCAGAKVTISAKMTALTQDDIPARTALQKESEKLTQAEVKLKHLTTVCMASILPRGRDGGRPD